jgi:hypothetical protein
MTAKSIAFHQTAGRRRLAGIGILNAPQRRTRAEPLIFDGQY